LAATFSRMILPAESGIAVLNKPGLPFLASISREIHCFHVGVAISVFWAIYSVVGEDNDVIWKVISVFGLDISIVGMNYSVVGMAKSGEIL
jgi:hypothetical protein